MATKKKSNNKKAGSRSRRVKASAVTKRPTYTELRQQVADSAKELEDCKRQLTEALEQQKATSEW